MATTTKRKTSLSLDKDALDEARELGLNVSAVADAALQRAVKEERRRRWLEENAEALAAQDKWLEENGHPLAEIMVGPAGDAWRR